MKITPRTICLVSLPAIAAALLLPLGLSAADGKKPTAVKPDRLQVKFKKGTGSEDDVIVAASEEAFTAAVQKHATGTDDLTYNRNPIKTKNVKTESAAKTGPSPSASAIIAGTHVAQRVTFASSTSLIAFMEEIQVEEPAPTPTPTPTATATPSPTATKSGE